MVGPGKSRWADTEEDDAAADKARKLEKEEKKRKKAEKARLQEDQRRRRAEEASAASTQGTSGTPATKRQKLSAEDNNAIYDDRTESRKLLRPPAPSWNPCRSVDSFELLNHIEEGSYGWVSRAKDVASGEVVALKKLKMEGASTHGFPVTGLREIQCLMESHHDHIVKLREIVIGTALDQVYLVMDFLEHDLKTLQEDMQEPFLASEIKTIMQQLTSAVGYLHDHWILHRDLKTSNILMNNRGEVKIADFGMARYFGNPPPQMTQLVVTLWYRAPELLLGAEEYDQAIDMWSLGCIFGELLSKEPLLQGKNEVAQLSKIFELCGVPSNDSWPGFKSLPNAKSLRLPPSKQDVGSVIRARFPFLTNAGSSLLASLLSLNPIKRPRASQTLNKQYFLEDPRPKHSSMFPTFPSKAGQEKRRRIASPNAPKRGEAPRIGGDEADFSNLFNSRDGEEAGAGFQLKLAR